MSYILEALRKAERERQRGEAPSVPEVLYAHSGKRAYWLPWLVVTLLLLSLNGGFLWYFLLKGTKSSRPTAPLPVTEATVKPTQSGAAETEARAKLDAKEEKPIPPPATPLGLPDDAIVSSTSQTLNPSAKESAKSITHQAKPAPFARPTPVEPKKSENSSASLGKEQPVRKPLKREPIDKALFQEDNHEPLPASEPVSAAKPIIPQKDDDVEQSGGIPLLEEMPQAIQRNIPNFKVNVLAYSSVPAERFAIIDMVKYSKGEQLPGGAILRDIQANGLVLELNGRRFRVSHR